MKKPLSEVILHVDEVRLAREFVRRYVNAIRYDPKAGRWCMHYGIFGKSLPSAYKGDVPMLMLQLLDELCREDPAWLKLRTRNAVMGAVAIAAWGEPPEGLRLPILFGWPSRKDRFEPTFSLRVPLLTADLEASR